MILKENELFRYSIDDTHVMIESVKADFPVVEFPKMLEGLPVTELAGYVLSGKHCEEVYIPEGITKIGRYGFYNCRNLRKLSFSSDFMDIGSGAFTGCHHIREIEVLMKQDQTCLKEVLVEVPEEVCVTLRWLVYEDGEYSELENAGSSDTFYNINDTAGAQKGRRQYKKAVLWFPEYFEESIENTPARILSVRTHGSGMFYRYCFQGKVFQFQEYDKRFENACVFESEKFVTELAYGRLSHPVELGEKARETYETYVQEHKNNMAKNWIHEKREDALEWLLKNFPHEKNEQEIYQEILECASKYGTPGMVSSLMDYGRRLFPPKRKSFDL